jgi:hypothetical protein
MSELKTPRRLLRSAAALLAGFLAVAILTLGADIALRALGIFPPFGQPMSTTLFLLSTVYRTAFGIVGSYITARLAPHRPMQHSLAGGVVGVVLSTAAAVATWNRGPDFGPHWYPLALIAFIMPTAWAGARLYGMTRGPVAPGERAPEF